MSTRRVGWEEEQEEDAMPLLYAADEFDSPYNSCPVRSFAALHEFRRKSQIQGQYICDPMPPQDLWDLDDMKFLEKVSCRASIRILGVSPKNGSYRARMKCEWSFRTLNSGDRTDVSLWVPGIRMPGLVVVCEESRLWREMTKSTETTIFWSGTSLFSLAGYEIFEMEDFPFDRQAIDLELLEFVWRRNKDSDVFDFAMKVVSFSVQTDSYLPEWLSFPAIVRPDNEMKLDAGGPAFASRFQVVLRIQRRHWFYVVQIFLVTWLITTVSCFPLAMPPTQKHVTDRLARYLSGILTLFTFKFGITGLLPSVPYSTYLDYYMLWQVLTIVALSVETIIVYRCVEDGDSLDFIDSVENYFMLFIMIAWMASFLYVAFCKRRRKWAWTLLNQEKNVQVIYADD